MRRSAFVLTLVLATSPALAQSPERDELIKNPKYAAKDLKPAFKTITADELRASVKVISGRSSALFGFNSPAVEVHLPRIDNSVYVVDKWDTPKLLDARGAVLGFEKEQGIYDHSTFSTEIRFRSASGKPPKFAKAVGTMTIAYPLAMKSVTLKPSDTKKATELGVSIDGPFVKAYNDIIAEASFGNELESVRAYDKTGRRLERVMGYSSSGFDESGNYEQFAFHGDVARVDVDIIEARAGLRVAYEMPPAPELPDSKAGDPSSAPATLSETPGGKFTLTPFRVIPPAALGYNGGLTAEQAREALAEDFDVPEANAGALLRGASDGDVNVVQLSLVAGIDPDVTSEGLTPLMLATSYGQIKTAEVLIAAGANVKLKNDNGATALHQAAGRCEMNEIVELLVKAGADVNAKALGGLTPLRMADAASCTANAETLKAAGAK